MRLASTVYSDFSGGLNDTSAAIAISDNQLAVSENVIYSAEVKALQTRNGCIALNSSSYGAEVTDAYSWLVGGITKRLIVKNHQVYEMTLSTNAQGVTTSSVTYKMTLQNNADHIYPFVYQNKLFFGDGTTIYTWGDTDYSTDSVDAVVSRYQIVKYTKATDSKGTKGHFYQLKTNNTSVIDFDTEDYTVTSKWTDVTDVPNFSSSVVREIVPYDPSTFETVYITVTSGATNNATITLELNEVKATFSVTAGQSASQVIDLLAAVNITGYVATKDANGVRFTASAKGTKKNGYIDPATSGVTFTYTTEKEGKDNDCHLDEIKKCTIFCVHQGSYRVFAAGNPDDNALYYSDIGNPTYFNDQLNKVYPAVNGYGQVTAMANLSMALIVSYEAGWYAWNGSTVLSDATWFPLNIPYGCVSARTLVLTPNSFTFLSKLGVYQVNASILNYEQAVLIQGGKIIRKLTENTVEHLINSIDDKTICEAVFYDNVYYLAYNTDKDEGNTSVLVYEMDTNSFTRFTGWKVNRFFSDASNLYFTSKNYVMRALEGYHDIDVETGEPKAINLHVKTKEYHFGTPTKTKNVQLVGFIFQQHDYTDENDHSTLIEESLIDVVLHCGYKKFVIDAQTLAESLIYGRTWGRIWGYREAIVQVAEVIMPSNTFQIEINNNRIDDPITLIGIGFEYETIEVVTPVILKDEDLLI